MDDPKALIFNSQNAGGSIILESRTMPQLGDRSSNESKNKKREGSGDEDSVPFLKTVFWQGYELRFGSPKYTDFKIECLLACYPALQSVVPWCIPQVAFEGPDEAGVMFIPHRISNFFDRHIGGGQQVCSMHELALQEHMAEVSAGLPLKQASEMGWA
jgi:hypothetical protein